MGYCPGTMAGAVGEGRLDALAGGVPGVIFGAWLFAVIYPKLPPSLLEVGGVGDSTFPEVLKRTPWVIVLPASLMLTGLLVLLERRECDRHSNREDQQ